MTEKNLMDHQLLAMSQAGSTVWRQNVGMGWCGKATRIRRRGVVAVEPGDVVVRQARPLHAGLCEGSSDIIGSTPVKICQFHVGTTLPVFTAVESKTPIGKLRKEQKNFLRVMLECGALCGVARTAEDAIKIIRQYDHI